MMKSYKTCKTAVILTGIFISSTLFGAGLDWNVGGGILDGGIQGEYFSNPDLSGSPAFERNDNRIDFVWRYQRQDATWIDMKPGGSISPAFQSVDATYFSVRWTGRAMARHSETYTFKAIANDGVRVKIRQGGSWITLIDQWSATGQNIFTANRALTANEAFDLMVEYRQLGGKAEMRLLWFGPSTPEEVINVATPIGGHAKNLPFYADVIVSASNWNELNGNKNGILDMLGGWPNEDFCFMPLPNDELYTQGRYLLQFKGRAKVKLQRDQTFLSTGDSILDSGVGYDSATNTTTAYFDSPQGTGQIKFFDTDRDGNFGGDGEPDHDGVTDLYLMRPIARGSTETHEIGEIFHRETKRVMERITLSRWNDSNKAPDPGFPAWSERTQYGEDGKGIPGDNHETKILLCNENGIDLWIQIYDNVGALGYNSEDENYIRNLARLIRFGGDANGNPYTDFVADPYFPPLNPNLKVYVEFSNEIPWNGAAQYKVQKNRVTEAAKAEVAANTQLGQWLSYDGNTSDFTVTKRYCAWRLKEASDLFRKVWGDGYMPNTSTDPRVRPSYMWQYANSNLTASHALEFMEHVFNNGDGQNHVTTPRPVNYYFWGGGAATYYSTTNNYGIIPEFEWDNADIESPNQGALVRVAPTNVPDWYFDTSDGGKAGIYRNADRVACSIGALGPSTTSVDAKHLRGFKFTVGAEDVAVYEVGRIADGSSNSHNLYIYDATTNERLMKCALELDETSEEGEYMVEADGIAYRKAGGYNSNTQEEMKFPILLRAGCSYYFLSEESNGGDPHYTDATITPPAGITINGKVKGYQDESELFHWKVEGTTNRSYGPVNFKIARTHVANASVDLGFPYDADSGDQAIFLAGASSVTVNLTLPEYGTYSVLYDLAQIRDRNGDWTSTLDNPLAITLLHGANESSITPRSRDDVEPLPMGEGWTHGDYGRHRDAYQFWGSAPFTIDSGSLNVQIRFSGTKDSDAAIEEDGVVIRTIPANDHVVFIDNLQLTSEAAIAASDMPFKGTATGQTSSDDFRQDINKMFVYGQAFGLHAAIYEGGFYPGGDWDQTPLQWYFAHRTPAARQAEFTAQQWFSEAGLCVEATSTLKDAIPQYDLANDGDYMTFQAWDTLAEFLPSEPANGAGPGVLSPHDALVPFDESERLQPLKAPGEYLSWNVIIPSFGEYFFRVVTDVGADYDLYLDGSELLLWGDGVATVTELTGGVYLTRGLHNLRLQSFDSGSFEILSVQFGESILPLPPYGTNLLVNSEFSDDLQVNSGTLDEADADRGWFVPKNHQWTLENQVATASLSNGAGGLAQVVWDQNVSKNQGALIFQARQYDSDADNELYAIVYGVNGPFSINQWNPAVVTGDVTTILFTDNLIPEITSSWQTYEIALDFLDGFEYLVVQFFTNNVNRGNGEFLDIDDVEMSMLEGSSEPLIPASISFGDQVVGTNAPSLTTQDDAGALWIFESDDGNYIAALDDLSAPSVGAKNNGTGFYFSRMDGQAFDLAKLDISNQTFKDGLLYTITGFREGAPNKVRGVLLDKRQSRHIVLDGFTGIHEVHIDCGSDGAGRAAVDNIQVN